MKKLVELVVFVIVAAVSFAVSVVDEEKPNVSEENDDKDQRKGINHPTRIGESILVLEFSKNLLQI